MFHKNPIEVQLVQRAFDGRWERIVKIPDRENIYSYTGEKGEPVAVVPFKWVTESVYDFLMEEVK